MVDSQHPEANQVRSLYDLNVTSVHFLLLRRELRRNDEQREKKI